MSHPTAPSDDLMPVWHLFLVQDGSKSIIMSAMSASQGKAEDIATAAAIDEHDMDPMSTGCTYLGVIDRDVCHKV